MTDVAYFANNSDNNFQLYHPLKGAPTPGANIGANQGQAIKFDLEGFHIGEEWVLQYLEAHTIRIDENLLLRFQG